MQILRVKIIPKSSERKIVGKMANGSLKIKLTSAPEHGKANAELLKFIAQELHISKNAIQITRGEKSRKKWLTIDKN